MKKLTTSRQWFVLASLALIAATAGWLRDSIADGIAVSDPLYYAGSLQESGTPVTGARAFTLILWDSETATASSNNKCQTTAPTAPVTNGRFRIALDPACTAEIKANPDLWIEVIVGATSLGRKKLGAVPYAVEAQRASEASGALKTRVDLIPIVTNWQSYTPVFSRDGGTEVAPTDTTKRGRYRRVGDSIEVRILTTFGAAPNSSATWWQWSLPSGISIDLAKLPLSAAGGVVGHGMTGQGIGNNIALAVYARSATTISATANGAGSYYINDTVPFAWGAGGSIDMSFTIPVAGWTATQ
jgi:hypothetical protein